MKDAGCPFLRNCFIIGSLRSVKIPSLLAYCSESYECCRYYQRLALSRPIHESADS